MISVAEARETILSRIHTLPAERVYLEDALGRYLAEDIIANMDIPLWDNSAMDGYAVRVADVTKVPTRLPVDQEIPAGVHPWALAQGSAARIMTGAALPEGSDAVVIREDTEEHGSAVVILRLPQKGDHIRFRGEDIKKGARVLTQGSLVGPAQIGVLASLRRARTLCHQRPLVAILSTGDEVVDLDEELSPGKIPSSNSYTLVSLVRELGAMPLYLGIAHDTHAEIRDNLARAQRADLILTSGGVSMGDYDLVKEVMTSGQNTMAFWQVEMKPGKPLAFGSIGDIPIIGLPGNPASAMISFYQFARPAILKMLGARDILLPRVKARLKTPLRKKPDRPHYIRGMLESGQELSARISGPQGSGILTTMAHANCFIVIPKEKIVVEMNELVDCEVFGPLTAENSALIT